jgi:dTDP-4-dehydrorhamnose reductase
MNESKRFLVFGANGLVGKAVVKQLKKGKYQWYGTYYKREEPGLIKLDITSKEEISRVFEKTKPDYVVNSANLAGGVDFCEKHPDLAKKFHLDANSHIGKLCEEYNSRMVLISTDYVFDGSKGSYAEEDEPNPLNIYGKYKLESERRIAKHVSRYTIIRTTNVFGWDPNTVTPNYMMNLYKTVIENRKFSAPTFLWGNPTYVNDLASAIIELCIKDIGGIFHVVGRSFINRYDWAKKACESAGWDVSLITPVDEIPPNMIPRPLKSNLSTKKFDRICETKLRDVDEGINAFIHDMKEND